MTTASHLRRSRPAFTVIKGGAAAFSDPDLGVHPALVHGSQRYVFGDRPVSPGDPLTCTPRIADIQARGRNELLTVEVDCRFEDGSLAAPLRGDHHLPRLCAGGRGDGSAPTGEVA